jgi:hypothetical protein
MRAPGNPSRATPTGSAWSRIGILLPLGRALLLPDGSPESHVHDITLAKP